MVRLDNHETVYISIHLFQAVHGKLSVGHWIPLLVIAIAHPAYSNIRSRAETNIYQTRQSVSTEEHLGLQGKTPHETREREAVLWKEGSDRVYRLLPLQRLSSMHHTALQGQHLVKGKRHCVHLTLHARSQQHVGK